MLSVWWVWLVAALMLGVLEVFVSGYILLGFAIGAAITGILLAIGGPVAGFLAGSTAATILVFAVLSLIAWGLLRRVVGVREGQVKVWDRDINED